MLDAPFEVREGPSRNAPQLRNAGPGSLDPPGLGARRATARAAYSTACASCSVHSSGLKRSYRAGTASGPWCEAGEGRVASGRVVAQRREGVVERGAELLDNIVLRQAVHIAVVDGLVQLRRRATPRPSLPPARSDLGQLGDRRRPVRSRGRRTRCCGGASSAATRSSWRCPFGCPASLRHPHRRSQRCPGVRSRNGRLAPVPGRLAVAASTSVNLSQQK